MEKSLSKSLLKNREKNFNLTLFSPAKLNLFFRVLKKRPDGFHEIASLYQAINLGDDLSISIHQEKKDFFKCSDQSIPIDRTNLILRAAELFRNKTNCKTYFYFSLKKKIPIEAGLGGGSSNAATTLWGINQLLQTKIEDNLLAKWGSELGSDVPFFFSSGRAYCEGRGEILSSQPHVGNKTLWIAKPKMGLSTPKVYQNTQIELLKKRDPKETLDCHQSGKPLFFNDLEKAAFRLVPELQHLKTSLLKLGFTEVCMTGSGTAFFCFGNMAAPVLPKVDFFPVNFIQRFEGSWY